jgi:hypothetical protein
MINFSGDYIAAKNLCREKRNVLSQYAEKYIHKEDFPGIRISVSLTTIVITQHMYWKSHLPIQ